MKEYFLDKKIGVLMGGNSREREVSFRSGNNVLDSLLRQGLQAWALDPAENGFIERLSEIDIAFIALHGRYGEDGCMQGLLELLNIPYTGSGVLASALGMNKVAAKRIFDACGIPTPKYYTFNSGNGLNRECEQVLRNFDLPVVAKPTSEGSSIGVTIIKEEKEVHNVIEELIAEFNDAFIEEFIAGTEVTVGILGYGDDIQALPILELVSKNEFYDYQAKYTKGMTEFIIPARLPAEVYNKTQEIALNAHLALGCHGFSRVDIMVGKTGIPYVHDVNTIPGLTDLSDLPACAKAVGISYDELIIKMLYSSIAPRRKIKNEKTQRISTTTK
ncbi:MAG: D-alanine--D-alanine ligase [bacterium]